MAVSHEPARPAGAAARLDRLVYSAEAALVAGALLVMASTYFLSIVHREATARTNTFAKLILRTMGYATTQEAPEETIAQVSDVVAPLVLGVLAVLLAWLAVATRERGLGAPSSLGKRLGWSAAIALGCYGGVKLVAWAPANWLCFFGFGGMTVAALGVLFRRWREARGAARATLVGAAVGTLLGGGPVCFFLASTAGHTYIWNAEVASLLLMYVGFVGASMATHDKKHLRVDAVRKLVPERALYLYSAIGGLLTVAFVGFLCGLAWLYLRQELEHGQLLEASRLPKALVVLPVVVAMGLMTLRFLGQAARDLAAWLRGEVPPPELPEVH